MPQIQQNKWSQNQQGPRFVPRRSPALSRAEGSLDARANQQQAAPDAFKEKIRDYKDLKIWQQGLEIVQAVYTATSYFPSNEQYTLTSQMRRASVSIPSNVAEGFMRKHTKEYIQFLYISLGSCAELDTLVILAGKRAYLKENDLTMFKEQINYEMRMLSKLINHLKNNIESRATSDK